VAIAGRRRSQRRLTVGWLHPNISPAASCTRLRRISATTITTESNRPITGGFPPGLTTASISLPTSTASM
jgi:hypothetical protein